MVFNRPNTKLEKELVPSFRDVRFWPKLFRLASNGINLGLLKIMFLYISAPIFKSPILKKSEAGDTANPDNSDFHTLSH